jgi:ABC-type multidrug transport system ATPase subunit
MLASTETVKQKYE